MPRIASFGVSRFNPLRAFFFFLLSIGLVVLLPGCGGGGGGGGSSSQSNPGNNAGNGNPGVINHVVFMLQENRSFDNYFGQLNAYRMAHGLGADVDGLSASNGNPSYDKSTTVHPFRWTTTVCHEQISPGWNESHRQFNRSAPASGNGTMDGFVYSAANYARDTAGFDQEGLRAMGYFDEGHLPYYYFMATQFATSDRFFSSLLSRTPPNRMYLFAATSAGWTDLPTASVSAKTIWQSLEEKSISWKIYSDGPTTLSFFQPFGSQHQGNIFPYAQYFQDANSGNLPSVAFIQNSTGSDEHPTVSVQKGAKFASTFINALMESPNWKDSVFFLAYDEAGGIYDHVPPPSAPNPDGIAPIDLKPTDTQGNFDHYGFRVPLLVISPFTKPGYVSHNVADLTAILRFIEVRYGLPNLTARDVAQPDMSEYFDFTNAPNANPPNPPDQPVGHDVKTDLPLTCSQTSIP
jgi:phospholipase C